MTYKELQLALKNLVDAKGHMLYGGYLNEKKEVLQAAYDRIKKEIEAAQEPNGGIAETDVFDAGDGLAEPQAIAETRALAFGVASEPLEALDLNNADEVVANSISFRLKLNKTIQAYSNDLEKHGKHCDGHEYNTIPKFGYDVTVCGYAASIVNREVKAKDFENTVERDAATSLGLTGQACELACHIDPQVELALTELDPSFCYGASVPKNGWWSDLCETEYPSMQITCDIDDAPLNGQSCLVEYCLHGRPGERGSFWLRANLFGLLFNRELFGEYMEPIQGYVKQYVHPNSTNEHADPTGCYCQLTCDVCNYQSSLLPLGYFKLDPAEAERRNKLHNMYMWANIELPEVQGVDIDGITIYAVPANIIKLSNLEQRPHQNIFGTMRQYRACHASIYSYREYIACIIRWGGGFAGHAVHEAEYQEQAVELGIADWVRCDLPTPTKKIYAINKLHARGGNWVWWSHELLTQDFAEALANPGSDPNFVVAECQYLPVYDWGTIKFDFAYIADGYVWLGHFDDDHRAYSLPLSCDLETMTNHHAAFWSAGTDALRVAGEHNPFNRVSPWSGFVYDADPNLYFAATDLKDGGSLYCVLPQPEQADPCRDRCPCLALPANECECKNEDIIGAVPTVSFKQWVEQDTYPRIVSHDRTARTACVEASLGVFEQWQLKLTPPDHHNWIYDESGSELYAVPHSDNLLAGLSEASMQAVKDALDDTTASYSLNWLALGSRCLAGAVNNAYDATRHPLVVKLLRDTWFAFCFALCVLCTLQELGLRVVSLAISAPARRIYSQTLTSLLLTLCDLADLVDARSHLLPHVIHTSLSLTQRLVPLKALPDHV